LAFGTLHAAPSFAFRISFPNSLSKSPEISRKISESQKNNPNHHAFKKLICPHCKKEGAYVAMKRWHFDRCRETD
jgi:hypothetical protein